jgi:YD repeat-containing protein
MNPGVFVLGGGAGGGGSGGNGGAGSGDGQGGDGKNGGDGAEGGGKGACGVAGGDGGGCPNHHGGANSGMAAKGDPVDVVTGRVFTIPTTEIDLPGPLPLVVTRAYSSAARDRDVGLGYGFSHSLGWEIHERRRKVLVWSDDGIEHDFGAVDRGAAVLGPHGWLLHREEVGFALDLTDGPRFVFAKAGRSTDGLRFRLSAIEDLHGNRVRLTYENGRLVGITDSVGREIRVQSTPEGRLAAFEMKNAPYQGQWIAIARYDYDDGGRLVRAEDADGHVTRYSFDDRNLLVAYERPTGLTFEFRYDQEARCVQTWGHYPDRPDPSMAGDVPALLADHETVARGIYPCRLSFYPEGYSEATDSITVHRYFGNAHGKLDKAVSAGAAFARTYDDRGFLTSFTDALGATTVWERDLRGRVLRETDALGRTTLLSRTPDGHIREIVDPEGGRTVIDRGPGWIAWTDPIGAFFQVRFDARGLVEETVAPDGGTTRRRYDPHGNLIEIVGPRGASSAATYDYWGRCISLRDPSGGSWTYTYTTGGRLVAARAPDGSTTRYDYDGDGNVTAIVDPTGKTTTLVYGGLGKLATVRRPDGTSVDLRYDREGRLVEVRNARGEVHRMVRRTDGLVVEETTFDRRTLRRGYDLMGRLAWSDDGSGQRTELERDLVGQLVRRAYADGTEEVFEHDQRGEVTAVRNGVVDVTFSRNAVGWIVRETQKTRRASRRSRTTTTSWGS